MKYSFQIGRLFGIPILVHSSFGLLLVFPAYAHWIRGVPPKTTLLFVFFILAIFLCVLLHELGHALAARAYNIHTRDIVLLPIGGMARLENNFKKPIQEAVVAAAGPAVNLFLFLLISACVGLFYGLKVNFIESITGNTERLVTQPDLLLILALLQANGALAIFNMFPAFPMDGSRVFRAIAAMRFGRTKATWIAAQLSYAMILLTWIYASGGWQYLKTGVWQPEWLLAVFGIFLWRATRNEYQQVVLDEILQRHTVANVLRISYTTFQASDPLHLPITTLTKGIESDFLVLEGDMVRGVLSREMMIEASKQKLAAWSIREFWARKEKIPLFLAASKQDSIKTIYIKMLDTEQFLMPIFEENATEHYITSVLGVVDMNMIQNYIKIQRQLGG